MVAFPEAGADTAPVELLPRDSEEDDGFEVDGLRVTP